MKLGVLLGVIDRVKDRNWERRLLCSNKRGNAKLGFQAPSEIYGKWWDRENGCDQVRYRKVNATG